MAGESAREVARRARQKARRLEERAALFEKGAEGECATADVLATLPSGWTAIHDVRWPGRRFANIDHVVVGPGGVFAIDSKLWSGRVTFTNGRVRQNGFSRERAVAGCADAGLAIAGLVGPHAAKVSAVLCFAGQTGITGWARDVIVCSVDTLTQMLVTRPAALTPDEALDVRIRLDTALSSATPSSVSYDDSTAGERGWSGNRRPPSSRSRARTGAGHRAGARRQTAARKRGSLARPVLGLALLALVLSNGPEIAGKVGETVTDEFLTRAPSPSCSALPDAQREAASRADRSTRTAEERC